MNGQLKALIVLMGLPSSGKSTIAKQLSKALKDEYGIVNIVIGTDEIRKLVPSQIEQFDPNLEPFIKDLTLNIIKFCLKNDFLIINDDMNYYKSMRHELKQIAEENQAHFILIHIQIPLEIALEWNQNRGLPIPQEVIQTVYERFDKPGDYNWDVPLLTIQSNDIAPELAKDEILLKVLQIINSPYQPILIQQPSKPGIHEKIDKITRTIIAEFAQTTKDPSLLKKLSQFRKDYLKALKIDKIASENIETDFSQKLQLFLKQIRRAR